MSVPRRLLDSLSPGEWVDILLSLDIPQSAELTLVYWYLTRCLFLPQYSSFMLCLEELNKCPFFSFDNASSRSIHFLQEFSVVADAPELAHVDLLWLRIGRDKACVIVVSTDQLPRC